MTEPLSIVCDALVGATQRHSSLLGYADEIEARIAAGDPDEDLHAEAHAARTAALAPETRQAA